MKYKVNVPAVAVAEDANFTRRLRVLYRASPELDIRLDEAEYSYEFEVTDGGEFRVEGANEGEVKPEVAILTVDENAIGEVYAGTHFSVVAERELTPEETDEALNTQELWDSEGDSDDSEVE